jgi:dolichyl-phosphate-mannose-protein mannosyltransferase
MTIPAYLKPENGPLGRAFAAWLDHVPAGLATRFVLLWFVILYTAFAIISSASLALSPELLEIYALGRHPAAGYAGHAPLAPLIAGGWFTLFPPTDWAFHVLTMVNAAAGLFAADRIARQYLDGDKRIAVLLLLLLTPFYQFMGQGFGASETMLSTWPIATWCFLRAFATRDLAWSAAAGVATALAVLGNYYSVFLIAGFTVAVLVHPGSRTFLRSWAPWLGAAVGAAVLLPHVLWLVHHPGMMAPLFATDTPPADPLWHFVPYVAGAGVVLAIYWIAVRPDRALRWETLWPPDPDGRMLVILLTVPLVLPLPATAFAGAALTQVWPTASAWFLLPIVLLRPQAASLTRKAAIRITALVAATTIVALAVAPLLAWRRHAEGTTEGREYYRPIGTEVTKAWRLATGHPLRVVTGDPRLASAVAFYSPDHPDPALGDETERFADGFAAVCRSDDQTCVDAAKQRAAGKPNVQFITYSTLNRYLGKPGRLERFFFILAPPGSKPALNLPSLSPLRGAPE